MNSLLFGGATARKRYADGRNNYGNDWNATQFFSNYAALPNSVVYGGVEFPSVEQAYVAAKFNDPAMSQFIAGLESRPNRRFEGLMDSPAQVARNLGRAKPEYAARDWAAAGYTGAVHPLREGWNDIKLDIMRDLVRQKFENNPDFAKALLATGDQELIEHTTGWGDRVYGMVDPMVARDNARDADPSRLEGENYLGRFLMEQRAAMGGTGLVGRFAPAPMPEQPAAAMKPTGQQVADGVQLKLDLEGQQTQEDPKRKAGDLLPWLLAAGGTGLAAYALAEELNRGNPGAQVPAPPVM
ncbi:MAG: NADAR family protein [Cyanobium sp. 49614_E6]|nr:NADAR family protein [Cyanobium sp. 49614_E6]